MKKITIMLIAFAFLGLNGIAQQILHFIPKERSADFEYLSAPDSLGKRTFLKTAASINSERIETLPQKLPYPIIFIHGLNSKSGTWDPTTNFMDSQYGLTFGGRFDYCLNSDADNTIANTNSYPTVGADLALFSGTWHNGDYFYVNFDVGTDGSYHPNGNQYDVLSNQSAIVKQGFVLNDAIYRVLQLTGREKVILMGHSMGGLAAREYLQNQSNWQPDGQSHVAKLVTTGTPHGGSNQVTGGSALTGVDCQSEAYRDLRATYSGSSDPGVYLFGGLESSSVMDNTFCSNFYNIDVNCSGSVGQNITGLNQKNIYNDLGYSCIIGECSGCLLTQHPGDGIVLETSANINSYYTLNADQFYYIASAVVEIHTDLPIQSYLNMQALDEPYLYPLSYKVNFDTTYIGFMTVQATNNPFPTIDYDDYKFTVSANMSVGVNISNIILPHLFARIVNSSYQVVGTNHDSNGSSHLGFSQNLSEGTYYLEIYGTATNTSYLYPYSFILNNTTGISENNLANTISIFPNPVTNLLTISLPATNIKSCSINLYDMLGEKMLDEIITHTSQYTINISTLPQGIYFLEAIMDGEKVVRKVVKM